MSLKRSFTHSLLILMPVLLIGLNMVFQVPARSLHRVHAHHHHGSHTGNPAFHTRGCDFPSHCHMEADRTCSICDAFDLFHTVFFSKTLHFPGYFTKAVGPACFHVPGFIQAFYLFCYARAPPGRIFPDQTV
ncbi:hypothetical protein [Desulfospira joergensenii]|uniref:hypothetical protein n=1 Tax=Desulfospira joergensenii TaxID=53329 RepID=UPI0003B417A7|nr:hypothetical protein [Desulfospira joergensenii]